MNKNKNYQMTFQRYEIKYLLENEQYQKLYSHLKEYLEVDEYGRSSIHNIYFDTPDSRLIRTSLEKPIYKEKFRLRSYGIPKKEDNVFLELKKKYKGIVYKRRETMSLFDAENYLYKHNSLGIKSQVLNEIDWFLNYYKRIEPAMYISYERVALYGKENPDIRVTFDENIFWRTEELELRKGCWGEKLLKSGQKLMEIKIPDAMPLWMTELLDTLNIYPNSFSKYGKAYQYQLMRKERAKKIVQIGGGYCA